MMKNLILKMTLAIFALILLGNIGVSAQKTDCSKTTDAEIVKAIYDKLEVKYSNQIIHVNVVAKDGVVTLQGWATTKKATKEIAKIAQKVSCVKKVDNKLSLEVGGGCNQGYKKCGDICILTTDTCNICSARTCN
jgi:BON domain